MIDLDPNPIEPKDHDENSDDDDTQGAIEEFTRPSLKALVREEDKKVRQVDAEKDSRTVFVGNLPATAASKKKKLIQLFKPFGKVESIRFRGASRPDLKTTKKVAVIKKTFHEGRNNLIAFVLFENQESAKKSLKLNGTQYEKFTLRIDLADRSADGSNERDLKKAVFIGNLDFTVEEETVRQHFEKCGKILDVRLIRDSSTGIGKGFGYVNFKKTESVEMALSLNNSEVKGRKIRVQRCAKKAKIATTAIQTSRPNKKFHGKQVEKKTVTKITQKKARELKESSFKGKFALKSNELKKKKKVTNKSDKRKKLLSKKLLAK